MTRFAPFIASAFPQTQAAGGLIESPLLPLPGLQAALCDELDIAPLGTLWLKADNLLPISGSIKARGGIYEVLKHAEGLALAGGLLKPGDDYATLDSEAARVFFSQYSIAVGSTGNLGLSIGVMGARLGLRTTVHMSADARQWKKDRLRACGVEVREYDADYGVAVEQGRREADADPQCHFVDDENSTDLFWAMPWRPNACAGSCRRRASSSMPSIRCSSICPVAWAVVQGRGLWLEAGVRRCGALPVRRAQPLAVHAVGGVHRFA